MVGGVRKVGDLLLEQNASKDVYNVYSISYDMHVGVIHYDKGPGWVIDMVSSFLDLSKFMKELNPIENTSDSP